MNRPGFLPGFNIGLVLSRRGRSSSGPINGPTTFVVTGDTQNNPGTGPGADVALSWNDFTGAAFNDASGLDHFVLQYKLHSDSSWTTFDGALAGASTTDTITALTENTSYDFRIKGVSTLGESSLYSTITSHTTWYVIAPTLLVFARPGSAGTSIIGDGAVPSTVVDFIWSYSSAGDVADWEGYVDGVMTTSGAITDPLAYSTSDIPAEDNPHQQRGRLRARQGNSVSAWIDTGDQAPIPASLSLDVDWSTGDFTIVDSVTDLQISQTSSSSGFSTTGSTSGGTLLAGDNWILAAVAWIQNGFSAPYSYAYGTVADAAAGHVLTAASMSPSDLAVTRSGTSVTVAWTNADQTNPDGYTLNAYDFLTGMTLLHTYTNITNGDTFTDLISAVHKKWKIIATNFVGGGSESAQVDET